MSRALSSSAVQVRNKFCKTIDLSELLHKKIIPKSSRPSTSSKKFAISQKQTRNKRSQQTSSFFESPAQNCQRTPLKINYQQYRSKSSSNIKKYYELIKSPIQNLVDFNNLSNPKKINSFQKLNQRNEQTRIQGVSLQNSYKTLQFSRNHSFKSHNCAFKEQLYANKLSQSQAIKVMSVEYQKKAEDALNPELFSESKEKGRKKFLKKGSALRKQIATNLLKSKLIKEHQLNCKKQHTEHDILKMVKLYKGFHSFLDSPVQIYEGSLNRYRNQKLKQKQEIHITETKLLVKNYQSLPERIVGKFLKPIIGWQVGPQLDIEYIKNQQNTQITMDHSCGFF